MEERFPFIQKADFEKLLLICECCGFRDVPELIDRDLFKDRCPALSAEVFHAEEDFRFTAELYIRRMGYYNIALVTSVVCLVFMMILMAPVSIKIVVDEVILRQ